MSQLFSVKDKVALVTGGTSGIGFMIAQGLVNAGAKVYVASRKQQACDDTQHTLSAQGQCTAIVADLSTEDGCDALVKALKKNEDCLDILVNNAGLTWGAPLEEYPDKAWDKINNLNVKAAFTMTKKLLPMLEKNASAVDPARVINITSVAGKLTGSMQAYAYGPSKAALNHLTQILANELAAKQITVNAIAPGVFPSKMTKFVLENDAIAKQQADAVPLGRLGSQEDMEGLVIFLCSPAGSYLTGNIINLDGGTSVKPAPFL
ncbi:3-oxoacyl-ACP reductase [Gammaproteobacteria bacterium 45_16_T64]|nr:3-oxoacyl-ACP reductase [Gammaproteobacteria bacterium 45_16_T64]